MPPREDGSVTIENAKLLWPNFQGKETEYNREGDRNFNVLLDEDVAEELSRQGWNIKTTKDREVDGEVLAGQPYVNVTVGTGGRPPAIVLITSRNRTNLSVEDSGIIDWADIENVDLSFRPYHWTVGANSGIKAYLKAIYVTVYEDELARKYADVPMAGRSRRDDED